MHFLGGLARNASAAAVCLLFFGCGGETEFRGGPPVAVSSTDATASVEPEDKPLDRPRPDKPIAPTSGTTRDEVAGVEEPPAIVDIQIPLTFYDRVLWHWECSADGDIEILPTSEKEAVVQGAGPHGFDPEELPDAEVVLTGRLCPPQERLRDVVFAVDVSGSMAGNDPMVNGSCGRLAAIETVVANLPADGRGRIGVLTFSNDIVTTSSTLFANLQDLATDIGGNFVSLICGQQGGTNFTAGMVRAASLLGMGREEATKELYFISDGQPNANQNGIVEAENLRFPGVSVGQTKIPVTIATVMLGSIDTVLEENIASLDYNGIPLHAFAADASTLASTLAALADNNIVTAEIMYRVVGTRQWTRIDIIDHMLDYEYTLPPVKLSRSEAPGGFEIVYQYRDRHGHLFTDHGKIAWRTKPRDTCQAVKGSTKCLGDKKE